MTSRKLNSFTEAPLIDQWGFFVEEDRSTSDEKYVILHITQTRADANGHANSGKISSLAN
jgi:hypothetical protein